MAATGTAWWLWAWAAWLADRPRRAGGRAERDRAALQPLREAPGRVAAVARPGADGARGFAAKGLFVMDGSRRSAHANAYFTGFGAAKRVVFFDTLLARLGAGEVEAVLAHELGHFKLHHIRRRMVTMALLSLAFFALLGWLVTRLWFYAGLGVTPNLTLPDDALALLLLLLVSPALRRLRSAVLRGQVAPRRVRGRRLRLGPRRRRRARVGAAEAARRQRGDADARPGVRALLLLASARRRAPRRARCAPLQGPSHHEQLSSSRSARRAPAR